MSFKNENILKKLMIKIKLKIKDFKVDQKSS